MPSRRRVLAATAVLVECALVTQSGCSSQKASSQTADSKQATPTLHWHERATKGRPWIVVAPHPDDETLGAGLMIAQNIAAERDVHILLLTRGTSSGVRNEINGDGKSHYWGVPHDPAAEGYALLTKDAFGKARYDELTTAVASLGGAQVHEAGLIDGSVTVPDAKAAISALVARLGSTDVGVCTPSWVVDDNPDHRAAGQALRELRSEHPTTYPEAGWYVLPEYWSDQRLQQVNWSWLTTADPQLSSRARNACRAYAAWHPPQSYAIGYHSVDFMFAKMDTNPRCMLHQV